MKNIFYILLILSTFLYSQCIEGEVELWNVCYNIQDTEYILLSDSGLSGSIPNEIGDLVNLQGLLLFDNQLTGEIPSSLFNLPNLWLLGLGNNQLEGNISDLVFGVNMFELYLNNNQFTGEIPLSLCDLNLGNLHLNNNQLSGNLPGCLFAEWELRLNNNQLSGNIPDEFLNHNDNGTCSYFQEDPAMIYTLNDNQFCPPYPESCNIGEQNTLECLDCPDEDVDTICDNEDTCFGFNPSGDVDEDGICDSIDPCYGPTTLVSWENVDGDWWVDIEEVVFDYEDIDEDGICDSVDGCVGDLDCAGECGGDAVVDNCGTCDNDVSNDCTQDCNGTWGGDAEIDECGECNGNGIDEGSCDCAGNVEDCAGECGGNSILDECGQCMCGSNSDPDIYECDDDDECEQGCDGLWYSDLEQLPLIGCDGICESDLVFDECGICDNNPDNNNMSCTGCMEELACNYNPNALFGDSSCTYITGCQTCENNQIIDNDSDDDTICDDFDMCDGHNDLDDQDTDSVPDDCDTCPLDAENDADGDGVCESDEVVGCVDQTACNYNADATEEDDSTICTYIDNLCETCEAGIIVDNDSDGDMVCNADDQCEGFDDSIDYDNDDIVDGCDTCIGIDTLENSCVYYGDVNQDGSIGFDDAMVILSYLLDSSDELLGMDYNQDGVVTLLDFTLLLYEHFSMNVTEEQDNTAYAQIGTFYDTISLFSDHYVGGVLLSLENVSDDIALLLADSYVSTYTNHENDFKILFMDDPEDLVALDTVLVTVTSGTYELNEEETQLVDINSHIPFSVVYQIGDVNMDISINVLDVVHMVEYILSITTEINPYADINNDGLVNVMDVIMLVYFIFDMS